VAVPELFLEQSRSWLRDDYVPRILACVDQLTDEDIWWRPNEASNSIGNLVLHLAGNARQWIVAGVGGAADRRDRPSEFARRETIPRTDLSAHFTRTMAEVDATLANVSVASLLESRRIQCIDTTVMGAIYHVVEHFSGHANQIVLLAKLRLGRDLGFWEILPDGSARPTWHRPSDANG
jgi:uncharacterized damage-inducible protein DinB